MHIIKEKEALNMGEGNLGGVERGYVPTTTTELLCLSFSATIDYDPLKL